MSTSNPYAPPRASVVDAPVEGLELAGRGVRLLACILDGVIAFLMIYLPALIVMVATGQIDLSTSSVDFTPASLAGLLCLIGFIAWLWITALLVARNGQTLGKRVLEIKVVRSDGSPASLSRIFVLRNLLNWLLGIIPLYVLVDHLFIFGVRQQCIHDLLADTIVVKA